LIPAAPVALTGQLVAQADRHPVAVYLARLAPGSRRTMRQALEAVATAISVQHTAETLPWPAVGYQHVAAVRAALLERGKAPATVNKTLAAVRGVLEECWRLGLVDAETYQRAADVHLRPAAGPGRYPHRPAAGRPRQHRHDHPLRPPQRGDQAGGHQQAAPAVLRAAPGQDTGAGVMDEPNAEEPSAVDDRPDPPRVDALRAAVPRAERGEGTPEDARELAGLARWLWEQFDHHTDGIAAGSAYHAATRWIFAPTPEQEADVLFRRLLG
jgi:hypothetical protein